MKSSLGVQFASLLSILCVHVVAAASPDLALYLAFDDLTPHEQAEWPQDIEWWRVQDHSMYASPVILNVTGSALEHVTGVFGAAARVRQDASIRLNWPHEAAPTEAFSVLFWVHPSGLNSSVSLWADSSTDDKLSVGIGGDLRPRFSVRPQALGGRGWDLPQQDPIDTERWTHLAWVYDRPTNLVRLFVDGRLRSEAVVGADVPRDWGSPDGRRGWVGIDAHTWQDLADTSIAFDDLNVWKRALSADEARWVMDHGPRALSVHPRQKQVIAWAQLKPR